MHLGVDCSVPPSDAEIRDLLAQGVTRIAGYIGGDTPYVWTPDDWERCTKNGFALIPVWVAPPQASGHDQGAAAGNSALLKMQDAGLTSICCLDVEPDFDVQSDYAQGFFDALAAGSCDLMLYGRARDIDGLVDRLCTWIASPTLPGDFLPDMVAAQLMLRSRYDYSLWDEDAPSANST